MERELKELKEKRQAILAKVLPTRLSINRDKKPFIEVQMCSECAGNGEKQAASVLCLECGAKFFCEACCDVAHCDRTKRNHLDNGLRFRECFGRAGFPKIVPKPRTPFMIYQDEKKRLQEEQQQAPSDVDKISVSFFITEYCIVVMLFLGFESITHSIAMTVSLYAAVIGNPK
ncbi:Hypothetical protein PHPALM_20925 [Phytophthora palmivora]|uniref:Uncharacterized protein n=1 Tax=Phytophthora palmivora TaxID=4796 RepID=A0A2P4XDL4_9STRA|nr:Hypothetical protein PHPALM_20925 [Phytophthora palmivora]